MENCVMTPSGPWVRRSRTRLAFIVVSLLTTLGPSSAVRAEKVVAKGDDWEAYTDGRVAGFASYVYGDGPPRATHADDSQGTVSMMRLRSGFLGNQLGFGVRGPVTQWTTVTGYIQIWAYVESDNRDKSSPNYPDIRT
jgi:hypothetical protein